MPRFHFHTADGRCFPDREGVELASIAAAQCQAVKVLAEFMRDDPCEFWTTNSLSVTVSDESGLSLFQLDLAVTASPVVRLSPNPALTPESPATRSSSPPHGG